MEVKRYDASDEGRSSDPDPTYVANACPQIRQWTRPSTSVGTLTGSLG